ncbi:MAG: hypothetical protein IPN36_14040 [Bacteroidetes bacterium]|nr:hypothetical protein [Bacteroidota bacterium]MBL0097837.1 hypothetical protein [Bacteroidota bacterium]
MEKKYVYDLHAEHREWLNKIAFYKDEIKIMRHRLEQVTEKNTSKEVLALVEHFQNQLIVQEEQNDILRHNVKEYENVIEDHLKKNEVAADHLKWDDHTNMRDQVDTYEKIFNDLRKELIGFIAKWM